MGIVLGKFDNGIKTQQHCVSDFTGPFPDTEHTWVGWKFDRGSTASNVFQGLNQFGLGVGNRCTRSLFFDSLQSLVGHFSSLGNLVKGRLRLLQVLLSFGGLGLGKNCIGTDEEVNV